MFAGEHVLILQVGTVELVKTILRETRIVTFTDFTVDSILLYLGGYCLCVAKSQNFFDVKCGPLKYVRAPV